MLKNSLSDNVMFVGDFNSKPEFFGFAQKNTSGPMLKKIQNKLNLIYLNNDEHTHMDRANGSTDILGMASISQNLAIYDIQFQIGADLGSDHLTMSCLLEISTRNLNPLDVPKKTPLVLYAQKIQNKLNLIYLNNDEHTHMDRANSSTDILDMAFISQNLAIHKNHFRPIT